MNLDGLLLILAFLFGVTYTALGILLFEALKSKREFKTLMEFISEKVKEKKVVEEEKVEEVKEVEEVKTDE